jgi:hypothetical protein
MCAEESNTRQTLPLVLGSFIGRALGAIAIRQGHFGMSRTPIAMAAALLAPTTPACGSGAC